MTAAEKLATNTALTVAARIAMFITAILVSVALFVLGNYLSGQARAMSEFAVRVAATEQATSQVEVRVGTLETRINIGQRQREEFQQETKAALLELNWQNLLILQAIARLEAKTSQ